MMLELEQIKASYETLNMSPEQIAEDRELDIVSVKAALMQCSSQYRRACNSAPSTDEDLNFTADDLRAANDVIRQIALGAEDDGLRLKAACYIRDDKRGRKDVVKGVAGVGIPVLQFNNIMKQVRATSDLLREDTAKLIN